MGQIYKGFYKISLYSVDIFASIPQEQPARMDKQVVSNENREIQVQHMPLQA